MAFILSTKRNENNPLFTVRRIIVSGDWKKKDLLNLSKLHLINIR